MAETSFRETCPHCGATATRRLGECVVCHRVVCEKCGNTQLTQGQKRVTHRECLKRDSGAFSMIKIVR